MKVPLEKDRATEFVSGKFSQESSLFINPYKGKVTGKIKTQEGSMYKVRKIHGELLMGRFGTKIVELVASWLIVLIITGIYIFWPSSKQGLLAFILPRTKAGRRIFFRDIHSIIGFWISGLLLLVLGGAFPWTDVVGNNFKWVQEVTHTGYPPTWSGIGLQSKKTGGKVHLDDIVDIAKSLNLPGETNIELPTNESGIYSIYNTYYKDLGRQVKYHYDQYSGDLILKQTWSDVGVLMRGRMWLMAFHQGQFGPWNWYLMLFIALALAIMAIAALVSYSLRKKRGQWGAPRLPKKFGPGYGVIIAMTVLGIIFPLFGLSLILIVLGFLVQSKVKTRT